MTLSMVEQDTPKVLVFCTCPDTGPVWAFSLQQKKMRVVLETSTAKAIQRWEQVIPDLIILDIEDTSHSALKLIKELRQETSIPILLLTPRREEGYLLEAYRYGADECIFKPVSPAMFMAKALVWLRRSGSVSPSMLDPIKAGAFQLIPSQRLLVKGDNPPLKLTSLELRLMHVLMCNPDRTINAGELVERVWGFGSEGNNSVLKNVIYRLRKKIETDPAAPRHILTVGRVGYRFVRL